MPTRNRKSSSPKSPPSNPLAVLHAHYARADLAGLRMQIFVRPFPAHSAKAKQAFLSSFEELGHDVCASADGPVDMHADAVLLVANPGWFPRALRDLAPRNGGRRPFVAVWQAEPLPLPPDAPFPRARLSPKELAVIALHRPGATDPYSNAATLRWLARERAIDLLAVSTRSGQAFLTEQGLDAEWVPRGYTPDYGRPLGLERDLDVVFLGAADVPRRRRLLRALARRGVQVASFGSWTDPAYWGESRTVLLNRTKVLLNLPRHAGLLSGVRMLLGMANGAVIVGEPMYDPAPYMPGEHFVSASLEEMPETIAALLDDTASREQIADRAHRFVTEELTLEGSVERLSTLIESRLARATTP